MTWTIAGSVVAIVGVVLLLMGAYRGGRANDEAHAGLAEQIADVKSALQAGLETKADKSDVERVEANVERVEANVERVEANVQRVEANVERVEASVDRLRAETRDGFRALSEQIAGLSTSSDGEGSSRD